jgi:uncharacterized protein (DUF924 family)
MIDDVLAFWFGEPATTAEEFGRKVRRWFMGGPAVDSEIRERFGPLVDRAIAGELDDWARTVRGRLALIVVLDQFPRSMFRDDARAYRGDTKAQALAVEAFDRGLDRELSIEQRNFLGMPFVHAESLALQDRAVIAMEALVRDAPEWQRPLLGMGIEQSRKYRDVISRFGRFPHRNAILGRTSTAEEEAFLVDWQAKAKPKGAAELPS